MDRYSFPIVLSFSALGKLRTFQVSLEIFLYSLVLVRERSSWGNGAEAVLRRLQHRGHYLSQWSGVFSLEGECRQGFGWLRKKAASLFW